MLDLDVRQLSDHYVGIHGFYFYLLYCPVPPVYPTGCQEAGFTGCCADFQNCQVLLQEGQCWCDHYCHTAKDCCPDISDICPEGIAIIWGGIS